MGSAVLGDRIYAVGGQHGHDELLVTQSAVHAYDPLTDAWTARASPPGAIGHISGATFAMDGRIVVLGGETSHGNSMADAEAYDPATDAWAALTPLPAARHSGVAGAIGGALYHSTGD